MASFTTNILKIYLKKLRKNSIYELFDIFKRKTLYSFYFLLNLYPSSAPFLSGDTFKSIASINYTGGRIELLKPEIIFLKATLLKEFEKNLKNINKRFILISHNSDQDIDKRYKKILNCSYLIMWYACNCLINHPKIKCLPLGLHNKRFHSFGVTKDFIKLREKKIKKIPKILYSFYPETNDDFRRPLFNILKKLKIADHFVGTPKNYRKMVSQYMFNASPPGQGMDTYRVWESIYLGSIPIVRTKKLYKQFENLPILILDDWKKIKLLKSSDLKLIYSKQIKKLNSCKCIWFEYWQEEIKKRFEKHKYYDES